MSLRSALKVLAALAAVCAAALVAVAALGIGIDAARWREPVAAALARAIGREVRLEGPARLTLSLRPRFVVGGIRIANPPGLDQPDFARIGELGLIVDLLPLLWGEARVRELHGRDATIRLARRPDGRGNWTFAPQDAGTQEPPDRPRLEIHRVALERVLVEYAGGGAIRRLELAELSGEAHPGEPVRFAARGRVDAALEYKADAVTAPLSALGGAEPWPFELRLSLQGTVLHASGIVSGPADRPEARVAIGAGTVDLREIERLLGVRLPVRGAASAGALVELAPGTAALRSLSGVAGTVAFTGELDLDTRGARPRLAGRLASPALEFGSFRAPGAEEGAAETLAGAFDALERMDLDLARLAQLDADVALSVARWTGVPGDVRDLGARIRLEAGRLTTPLGATIAGARFEGELAADATAVPPRLRAQLVARDAPLDGLAELLFDVPYVAGRVRRFELALEAAGDRPGALARDLAGSIAIEGAALTYGNFAGGRPVAMRLDAVELGQPRGGTIAGKVRGSLRDKPFAGTFGAGTVERILRDRRTPFRFEGASGGVRARLSGTLAEPDERSGPEVALDVTAPRVRELAPWLGLSSGSDAPVALKGTVRVVRRQVTFDGASLVVGRTSLSGEATWETAAGRPFVRANVSAERLALGELRALTAPERPARATLLEIPILPESLDFADSDIALRVKRFDGVPLELADASFEGRLRGGELKPSPFSLRIEGNALAGALALDARTASPAASLWLAGGDFDAGAVLRRLRIARDVDARVGTLRLYADIRERRLGDALEHSSFVAAIESATIEVRDANTRAGPRMAVERGELRGDAGAPVIALLTGTVNAVPVAIKAETGRLRELAEPAVRLPFSLTAELPAAKLAVSGAATPARDQAVALSVALTGGRLDGLDDLLEASLPPWGPYAFNGRLRFSKRGYEVDAARVSVGATVLEGRGSLDTSRTPPKLDLALSSERIQLDDFLFGDWSPFESRGPAAPLTVESARAAIRTGAQRTHAIFSRELLHRLDGDLDVVVNGVRAGVNDLGRGRLAMRLAGGRATIGPAEIQAGGGMRGTLVYEPRERDVVVDGVLKIDRFDYGALMQYLRPGADVDGALSLDLRVAATAPRLSAAFAHGSGRFDFALWPERVQPRFDLWAANLLFRLLPIIDVSASPMNCLVGQFDLDRGRLQSVRLVIDTVNTRTEGGGRADLTTDEVSLRFVPRAKVPQFFSLATPIEVSGTFDDYRFGVRPADAFGTALRWIASPVVVPIQRLAGERIPPDGRDVCANPRR